MNPLMTGKTTDGDSNISEFVHGESDKVVCGQGTWDGATITLKVSPSDGVWIDIDQGDFTDDFVKRVAICHNMRLKGTISSAGGSTSLSMWIGE